MTLRLFAGALALALALAACRDTNWPAASNGTLRATMESNGIRLENSDTGRIYFFVANGSLRTLAPWSICTNPDSCPAVGAHETRLVAWSEIFGGGPSADEYLVVNWRLARQPDGSYAATMLDAVVLRR